MRSSWSMGLGLVLAILSVQPGFAEDAESLAVKARGLHEAAGLESDPDKRLSLLRHARETLERIAREDPNDVYAGRLQSGQPILALTLAGIDQEIAAIEREKKRLTGTAGSYVVLFDAQGKPLYSAYWVAPHAISIADGAWSEKRLPNEVPTFLIDRYLLSKGLSAPYYFFTAAFSYAPLADDFDVPSPGHGFSTIATLVRKGAETDSADGAKTFAINFAWQEQTAKLLSGVKLDGTAFTASNAIVFDLGEPTLADRNVAGIYVPALSFGFDRQVWDMAQSALIGRDASSSADFAVILRLADKRLSPAARQCLTDLRAAPDYKAYNEEWGRLERRNEQTLVSGLSDILADPDGVKPYLELDRKYAVGKRFADCQLN